MNEQDDRTLVRRCREGDRAAFGELVVRYQKEADEAPGPEQRVAGEQLSRAIEDELMRIKPELRAVLVLRHFMHLSYEDMGQILQVPAKTVKSRLHSARLLLRDRLLHNGTL